MNQVYQCKFLTSFLMIVLPFALISQYKSERIYTDEFPANEISEISINHKYGDISISKSKADNIAFKYHILLDKDIQSSSDEQLDLIETNAKIFGGDLDLELIINNPENSFLSRLVSKVLNNGSSEIEVQLEVSVPSGIPIEVKNEFGNVLIVDWVGELRCNLKHGDLRVTSSLPKMVLHNSYGKVNIEENDKVIADLKNINFFSSKIDDFVLKSSGSEFDIKEIRKADLNSKRDEIFISKLQLLKGDLQYSTIRIDEITEDVILDLKVSEVVVSKLSQIKPDIYIDQDNSEVELNIANTVFDIKANLKGGIFRVPQNANNLEINSTIIDEEKNERQLIGTYGTGSKGNITITGKKGLILLTEN